ncbi:hypothetical protein MN2019_24185 [Mycolicibacterium neoaurum]|uniref:linalool dehydratase/isomerase domain-containing protein n=1 Tax=Mycolicibacterium neoaurum TaxID=1795 RepID=UPI001BCB328E|nr:hypothetical protein [Mycolicibacterium neoaurum]QVI27276.1 hypothetical protein MN2019_24185 [Mycolicibacterium neoaurum]
MTLQASPLRETPPDSGTTRGPLATRWIRRATAVFLAYSAACVLLPWLLDAPAPWRAFGAGMVVPGAGVLYAIPGSGHPFGLAMVIGHAAIIGVEVALLAWALKPNKVLAAGIPVLCVGVLIWGCVAAPGAVVIAGHVAGSLGVLAACGWALAIRWIGRADSFTLVAIVVTSAAAGAGLTALHSNMEVHTGTSGHQAMSMPLSWIPWAVLVVAVGGVLAAVGYAWARDRSARPTALERRRHLSSVRDDRAVHDGHVDSVVRTSPVPLDLVPSAPEVTEAGVAEVQLMRSLVGVAAQPVEDWGSFDDEAAGPLQQYRYQVNALGWALAMYQYSHAPAYAGALSAAQVNLIRRAQHKAVWGYWYWQNLLGNWDFVKRRADPVGNPQNIMFTGYLNLQLGMYRQATGDSRFDEPGSIVFDWSDRQRYEYSHREINSITIGNFDQDLCLWPCEPVVSRGRKRGFVFPYCNAVATAGIGIADTFHGSAFAPDIARQVEAMVEREFTLAGDDLVAFIISGLGLRIRSVMVGTSVTATIAAFLAPLCPDLSWRAWETIKREWLETGDYRVPASAGAELPDWATNAKTNAAPLAGAMLLANSVGERDWQHELWQASMEQLRFGVDESGVGRFADASVYGNGMLGFGGFARPFAFRDMLTRVRPDQWQQGPRLKDAPHPDVLVAKAVTDGHALDMVLNSSGDGARVMLEFDRLRPGRRYLVHGGVDREMTADEHGLARAAVDVGGRVVVEVRPA